MDCATAPLDGLAERLRGGGTAICVAPPPSVAATVVTALYETVGDETPTDGDRADDEGAGGPSTDEAGADGRPAAEERPATDERPTADERRADDPTTDDPTRGSTDWGTAEPVRLLTAATGDRLFPRFDRATEAAELVERGRLAIRTTETARQRLTVTDERVYAHLRTDDEVQSPTATDDPFRSAVWETATREWETANPVTVSTPARSRFLRTFGDEFPEAGETLAGVLSSDATIRRDGSLDPVSVVTLVAARHELQTKRVSEWAEALDFSSRTELSRVTGRLADAGVLATERVPQGVGRPRQRLTLAVDALRSCPPADFLSQARRVYPDDE